MAAADSTEDQLIEELKEILAEEFYELADKGCEVPSEKVDGVFRTVHVESLGSGRWSEIFEVVTELPDGRFFRWSWKSGLTEYQDNEGPGEFGEVELTEVFHRRRTIIIDEYKPREKD